MLSRRMAYHGAFRRLGVGLLILSLGHTPLPKADYHNIRHHDGPGEVCRYHDHLLRWHPDADLAEDVAILHWHWFLPMPGGPDRPITGDTPGLQTSVPDWSGLTWDGAPQLAPEARSRFVGRPDLGPLTASLAGLDSADVTNLVRAGPRLIHTFGATFARRTSLASLRQRWNC